MIVFPANNSNAHKLDQQFPGRLGLIMSPGGQRNPKTLPYVLDNGKFAKWQRGKAWDAKEFETLLEWAMKQKRKPEWIAVPDAIGDADLTFKLWKNWAPQMSKLAPLAVVVQDGMTPSAVAEHTFNSQLYPSVIFVGGTTAWKRRTIWTWCNSFSRVHVGRINTEKWLWNCHKCGAESCDGTGWFRGDRIRARGLYNYLRRSQRNLGPAQLELEFARTFGGSVSSQSSVR